MEKRINTNRIRKITMASLASVIMIAPLALNAINPSTNVNARHYTRITRVRRHQVRHINRRNNNQKKVITLQRDTINRFVRLDTENLSKSVNYEDAAVKAESHHIKGHSKRAKYFYKEYKHDKRMDVYYQEKGHLYNGLIIGEEDSSTKTKSGRAMIKKLSYGLTKQNKKLSKKYMKLFKEDRILRSKKYRLGY